MRPEQPSQEYDEATMCDLTFGGECDDCGASAGFCRCFNEEENEN